MKKFSKLLAVVVAIAVVVCPMMSIVSSATSTGGYKIEALDENNLKLTISSTDGFIAYSASVGFNSASAFQSTYSSDGYTNGVKLIDYTTKTAAKSSYNTPQISANATGSALNVVVMPSDINNLDLLTEVVIGLRVANGTTASLTKIQAADDGADITEDPTLLSFPAADANTGAIDSTASDYIASNATTNAHSHSFTQQTQTAAYLRTAATCSANATYWYSCATCGLASSTNYFTATGTMLAHTPDNTETFVKAAATCTEDAQYWQECSVCHQQLSTYWTKPNTALGHSMTYHAATASTCEYQGNDAYYSCSRCGKLFGDNAGANEVTSEEVTRALGDHTASNTKKFLKTAADCTNDAVYYQECSVCGIQLVTTWTDTGSATGHSFGEYVADGNATCETDGTKTRTCSACGATETVTDTGSHSSVAHTPAAAVTENTVAATCSATGSYDSVVYCSVCGAEISRTPNVIAKLAHTVVEDAAVPATCTATGLTAGSHCSVCNEVIVAQTVVPATGHTAVEDAAVPATCTETGLTAGSHCSVCNEVLVAQTVVPATGHTWGEWTSNADGHSRTCSVCSAVDAGEHVGDPCEVCGYEAAPAGPVNDANIALQDPCLPNISAGLRFRLRVMRSTLPAGTASVKLNIIPTKYTSTSNAAVPYNEYIADTVVLNAPETTSSNYYNFFYDDVDMRELGLSFDVIVDCYDEGGNKIAYSNAFTVSPVGELMKLYNNPSSSASLKNILANLLEMGAKAQVYFAYQSAAAASSDLMADVLEGNLVNKDINRDDLTTNASALNIHDPAETWDVGAPFTSTEHKLATSLVLGKTPTVQYSIYKATTNFDTSKVSLDVSYTSNKGTAVSYTLDGADAVKISGTKGNILLRDLAYYDSNVVVTATLKYDGATVWTKEYTVESGINSLATAAGASENLINLVNAVSDFGAAARNYTGYGK